MQSLQEDISVYHLHDSRGGEEYVGLAAKVSAIFPNIEVLTRVDIRKKSMHNIKTAFSMLFNGNTSLGCL